MSAYKEIIDNAIDESALINLKFALTVLIRADKDTAIKVLKEEIDKLEDKLDVERTKQN